MQANDSQQAMDAPEPLRIAEEAQPIIPMHVAASSCEASVSAKNLVLLEFPMPIKHTQVLQMSMLECDAQIACICNFQPTICYVSLHPAG
jgi:hypothetical protein